MKLPLNLKKNILPLFVTQIGLFEVPNADEINPQLEEAILKREKEGGGLSRSNRLGWHSQADLLKWPEPVISELSETFNSAVQNMIAVTSGTTKFKAQLQAEAWANVNRTGSSNAAHLHPGNHWSAVYYVRTHDNSADEDKRAGSIQLYDPRGLLKMFTDPANPRIGRDMHITPKNGNLLIFPSWLLHSVNPFEKEDIRISIAFNAKITSFERLAQEDE